MAETEQEQQPTSGTDPATQQVVTLLTSILSEVQTQVRSKTPKPLGDSAAAAVGLFREIGATLAVFPSITLTATPARFTVSDTSQPPFTTKLTWSSTEAQTVSIERKNADGSTATIGIVTPTEGGSRVVNDVAQSATFTATATAKGPCGSAQIAVEVVVHDGTIFTRDRG
jgi:hypothetical protein